MYLIHPGWFYCYGLIHNLFVASLVVTIISGTFILISSICYAEARNEVDQMFHVKNIKRTLFPLVFSAFISIFMPSQKTMMQMAVASYATSDNIEKLAKNGKIIKDELKTDFIQIIKSIKENK